MEFCYKMLHVSHDNENNLWYNVKEELVCGQGGEASEKYKII